MITAEAFISGRDLATALHPQEPVEVMARQLGIELAKQKERVVEAFFVSGAMPGDLRVAHGPVTLKTINDIARDGMRVLALDPWRIL